MPSFAVALDDPRDKSPPPHFVSQNCGINDFSPFLFLPILGWTDFSPCPPGGDWKRRWRYLSRRWPTGDSPPFLGALVFKLSPFCLCPSLPCVHLPSAVGPDFFLSARWGSEKRGGEGGAVTIPSSRRWPTGDSALDCGGCRLSRISLSPLGPHSRSYVPHP